jgi:hypothetical protein
MGMRNIEFVNSEYYHVFNRGVDKRSIFTTPMFVVNLQLFVFFLQISVDFLNHIRIIRTISTTLVRTNVRNDSDII